MLLFKALFVLCGIGLAIISLVMVVLYTDLLSPRCPSVHGRVCNYRGVCDEFGSCQCGPLFRGKACEKTRCPGYNELTGIECSGRGLCSPLMIKDDIPAECQEEDASFFNGYTASGPGWGDPGCKARVESTWAHIASGEFSDDELVGIPTCACHPPYGGITCELNLCPQSSEFEVCSGNGNKSVGVVRNNTVTGDGCQCQNHVSLMDMLTILPRSSLEQIQGSRLHSFKLGFCGVAKVVGTTLLILQNSIPDTPDVKCFCSEKYFGEACGFGVCPEMNGVTCSGHGHPDFGFGVEKASLIKVRDDCTPLCAAGTTWCKGRCAATCKSALLHCPADKPYRCPSRECVAGAPQHCSRGFVSGHWDNLTSIVRSIACTLESGSELSPLRQTQLRESCFGPSYTATLNGFIPGGPISFSSGVLVVDLELSGTGSLNATYGSSFRSVYGAGRHHLRFESTADDSFVTAVQFGVIEKSLTSGYVVLHPHPLVETMQVRAKGPYSQVVIDYVRSELRFDNASSFDIFQKNGLGVFGINGVYMSLDSCFGAPWRCVWTWPELKATSAQQFLCVSDLGEPWISLTECELFVPITRVLPVFVGFVLPQIWSAWEVGMHTWMIQAHVKPPPSRLLLRVQDVLVTSISYVLLSDVVRPCLCFPLETNQSVYNQEYIAQPTRVRVNQVDEPGLGVIVDPSGFIRLARGMVVSVNPFVLKDSMSLLQVVPYGDVVRLTTREFDLGSAVCDEYAYPVRCNDGSCSKMELVPVQEVKDECKCVMANTGLRCECMDTFDTYSVCHNEDCEISLDMNQVCFWSPAKTPVAAIGFRRTLNQTYISLDSHTMPLFMNLSNCNGSFAVSGLTLDFQDCVGGRRLVRVVHGLNVFKNRWIASSDAPFTALFLTYLGGISIYETGWQVNISASSHAENAIHTVDTGAATWSSSLTDHDAALHLTFETALTILWVYCEFETVGLSSRGAIFPVSVFIQGSVEQNPQGENWMTLAKISDTVVNGSSTHSIPLHHDMRYTHLRLYSFFPLSVRTFIPFTDQNCTSGILTGTPIDIKAKLKIWAETPPLNHPDCICDNSCVISGTRVAGNGFCTDALYYNQSGVTPFNGEVCATGTDCVDCGTNLRMEYPDAKECSTPYIESIIAKYANVSFGSVIDVATIGEFIASGTASFNFTFTKTNKTVNRWVKPQCVNECLLYTCLDGTCAKSVKDCPEIRYRCKGDGCVRASIEVRQYKCACEEGRSGIDCAIYECTPGDPLTGMIDPHKWCSCNGPSPLKIKPPYELIWGGARGSYFMTEDILALNRPTPRQDIRDVGWLRVFADKAPYGIPFLRKYVNGNITFFTNCPFRVKTLRGVFLELDQCVERRSLDFPNQVLQWKDVGGGQIITWESETQYDDSPYRCASGHCVANERDCYSIAKQEPICGGGGQCLSDGTCKCKRGRETFIITPELTDIMRIPYYHTGPDTNPTVWGIPNNNRYVSEWCQARNCSEVDCSPPKGCFPGTPSLLFADAMIVCPAPHFTGKCAIDIHNCMRGEVTDPLVCSGNGELRRRDYRPEEYYCECGSLVDSVFTPNGYGGVACQDYSCQEDSYRIYYTRNRPHTLDRFLDINGMELPGRWMGPCGVSVGANPDHIAEWNICCPEMKRLEACDRVPCIIGGVTQCVHVDECLGVGREPKVYACNGKGTVLADGSCNCNKDEASGTGYTYDLDVYSTKGCFAKVQCALAQVSGVPCNAKKTCGDLQWWTDLPNIAYLRQQAEILVAREGLPLSKQSIVERLMGDGIEEMILQTYVQLALEILGYKRALATDICVSMNDTAENPLGMQPYTGPGPFVYKRSLNAPFYLTTAVGGASGISTVYAPLIDGIITSTQYPEELASADAVASMIVNHVLGLGIPVTIATFNRLLYIDIIRVHIRAPTGSQLSFWGSAGATICHGAEVQALSTYVWVELFCIPQYEEVRFDLEYSNEWVANCQSDLTSLGCEDWMQRTCLTIANAEIRKPGSLVEFQGCNDARCCVRTTPIYEKTTSFRVLSSKRISVDEIAIFAHNDAAEPLPQGLINFFNSKFPQPIPCVDEIAFFHPEFGLGGHLSHFRGHTTSKFLVPNTVCQFNGGVMASTVGTPHIASGYANTLGEACYLGRLQTDPGCYVNARDRNEIWKPLTLAHIIEPSCSKYGCYIFNAQPGISYHSDPFLGTQWNSQWASPQVEWYIFIEAFQTASRNQRSKSFFRRLLTNTNMLPNFTPNGDNPLGYVGPINNEQEPYRMSPYLQYTGQGINVYNNVATIGPLYISSGQSSTIWSSDETCLITISSQMNCGNWYYEFIPAGSHIPYKKPGFTRTVLLNPENYDYWLGRDILANIHDEGPDQSGSLSCAFRDVSSPCAGADDVCCMYTGVWRSFSVSGNCNLTIISQDGQTMAAPTTTTWGKRPIKGSEAYSGVLSDIVTSETKKMIDPRIAWDDCYPELARPTAGDADGGGFLQNSKYNHFVLGQPFLINHRGTSGSSRGGILGAYIIPLFSASKFEMYPMAERGDMYDGTDSFTMGYLFHSYMCSALLVRRIKNVIYGSSAVTTESTTVLGGDGAYYPVATSGPLFFKQSNPNCKSTPSAICDVIIPFHKCTSATRHVRDCNTCRKTVYPKFEWNQEFSHENAFVKDVDALNQVNANVPAPVALSLYTDWTNTAGTLFKRARLEDMAGTRQYARLLAMFTPALYRVKFEMQSCLKVVKTTNPGYPYQFVATHCSEELHPVCVLDSYKFAAQAGWMCTECGPASRTKAVDPGATVFSRYPRAQRANDTFGHMVLDAFLDGSLAVDIGNNEMIPWGLVYEQIPSAQFIFAFPEARDALIRGISTRPGYTSRGQVSDAKQWIDFDFARWFPVTCPAVISKETGYESPRCAISKEYCVRNFEAQLMNINSMPTLLFGMANGMAPESVPECGSMIYVNTFHISDANGYAQPSTIHLVPIATTPLLILRVEGVNSTWTNTGKRLKMSLDVQFSAHGTIRCSVSVGYYRMWIGTLSMTYGTPQKREYIMQWTKLSSTTTTFTISHTPTFTYYSIFGIDFSFAQIGSQISLSSVLITTAASIARCQSRTYEPYYELPSSVESFAPVNRCVFSDKDKVTHEEVVGTCSCALNSPTDGPTCEWPATISGDGKQVCNGYGDDGGLALTKSWLTTPLVSDLGVYMDGTFWCKCINPGLIARTVMRPASAFDYAYYIRNDKRPNAQDFILVTEIPNGIALPIQSTDVVDVCNSVSAVLPSWNTASEIDSILQMNVYVFFTDLIALEGKLVWNRRSEDFSITPYNTSVTISEPCTTVTELCLSLNWNNRAFLCPSSSPTLTDGKFAWVGYTSPQTITFFAPLTDIIVELHLSSDGYMDVKAGTKACKQTVVTYTKNVYKCIFTDITSIQISRPVATTMWIREVRVFDILDTGRVPGYFHP